MDAILNEVRRRLEWEPFYQKGMTRNDIILRVVREVLESFALAPEVGTTREPPNHGGLPPTVVERLQSLADAHPDAEYELSGGLHEKIPNAETQDAIKESRAIMEEHRWRGALINKDLWGQIATSAAEAANMRLRFQLMNMLCNRIRFEGWDNQQAAEHFGVGVDRIDMLMMRVLHQFSFDDLVAMLGTVGWEARFQWH